MSDIAWVCLAYYVIGAVVVIGLGGTGLLSDNPAHRRDAARWVLFAVLWPIALPLLLVGLAIRGLAWLIATALSTGEEDGDEQV